MGVNFDRGKAAASNAVSKLRAERLWRDMVDARSWRRPAGKRVYWRDELWTTEDLAGLIEEQAESMDAVARATKDLQDLMNFVEQRPGGPMCWTCKVVPADMILFWPAPMPEFDAYCAICAETVESPPIWSMPIDKVVRDLYARALWVSAVLFCPPSASLRNEAAPCVPEPEPE